MQSTNLVTTNLLRIILPTYLPTYLPRKVKTHPYSITGIPIDDNVAVVGSVWPKKERKKEDQGCGGGGGGERKCALLNNRSKIDHQHVVQTCCLSLDLQLVRDLNLSNS